MMLIPSQLNLGSNTNTVKDKYFSASAIYSSNPVPVTPGSVENSPGSAGSRPVYQCPSADGRMFAPKMQSDIPGFHMYAAAAVVTGQPGSSALNSPASYAAASAPTHSIVPPHYGSPAIDPSPYYTPLGSGYDMKGDMWSGGYNQPAPTYYQYDTGFGPQYPYERYCGMDMNDGVRRKNATRESTNTLKAWLQEHKKNPYPTKGEKIMLAIITKMTLTQVSTWFANARRRLKKENKMTWIPKNRANESGSGNEDRRQSDDKDTDEKSDDEDCKSVKDDDEQPTDMKLEGNSESNPSCQYDQQNSSSLHFPRQPITAEDNCPTDSMVSDSVESKPSLDYDRPSLHAGNASAALGDKLPGMGQQGALARYESGSHDNYNRPIWSPIDSHPQKNMNLARPYISGYSSEYSYQGSYNHEINGLSGRRMSSSLPQPYSSNFEMQPMTHQGMPQNVQDSLPLHHHSSTTAPHMAGKMYSPLSCESVSKQCNSSVGAREGDIGQTDAVQRNQYPYTSPVTNLRNWVNGVFHGPHHQASGMCEKKSPSETDAGMTPEESGQFSDHSQYNQRYMHPNHSHSTDDTMGDSYMLQHRSLPAPYNNYYHEPVGNDMAGTYPPQSITDVNQHPGTTYYSHQSDTSNHSLLSTSNSSDPSRVRPNSSTTQESFVAASGSSSSAASNVLGAPQHCHTSPSPCQPNTSKISERRPSTCQNMPYYDTSDDTSATPTRSSVPPPPYASQCKFGSSASQSQSFLGNPPHAEYPLSHRPTNYDSLDPTSNKSATSHSPRPITTGIHSRDGGSYSCSIPSDDEAREMRKMQPSETINEKSGR
ncbi:uncharacterized protein LOC120332683 [Styela clava]